MVTVASELSDATAGDETPGRDADPLREARTITRKVLPKLPGVDYQAARDYAGVHMGLPVQMYADRRPVDPQHVEDHIESVRDGIRELLKGHAGETAIEDFIRVDVEGASPAQRARERNVGQSTVRTNVRDVKQRLPRVADEWEGL